MQDIHWGNIYDRMWGGKRGKLTPGEAEREGRKVGQRCHRLHYGSMCVWKGPRESWSQICHQRNLLSLPPRNSVPSYPHHTQSLVGCSLREAWPQSKCTNRFQSTAAGPIIPTSVGDPRDHVHGHTIKI